MSKYVGMATRWSNIQNIRARLLQEAHTRADETAKDEREKLALEISEAVKNGEQKSRLARELYMSRSTLDNLLKEFKGLVGGAYTFTKGFMSNVVVVGKLPDSGGFPGLSGEVKVRFISQGRTYVAADEIGRETHSTAELEFMTDQYGDEAYQWALANGVVKSGSTYYDDEDEPDEAEDNWV